MSATMSRTLKLLSMSAAICLSVSTGSWADLSPELARVASQNTPQQADSLVDIVVFLDNESPAQRLRRSADLTGTPRSHRIKTVTSELRSFRAAADAEVEQFLNEYAGGPVRRFWITPAFAASVPLSKLSELAAMDGVNLVVSDVALISTTPVEVSPAPADAAAVSDELQLLNVPALWARGLTGRDRLVCSFDTGVDVTHPDLADKWRGKTVSLSTAWFSTVAPNSLPSDKTGHGTHTMGLLVGSSATDIYGVAYEAEWITAGVIDQGTSLGSTISSILAAFEWALDPDGNPATTGDVPDVILNSWGIPKGLFAPCDETFSQVIDNVEAAGIVTIFAAGNEGPNPKTIRNPGDRAATPLNTMAVGAIDNDLRIGDFSSRGPSSCDATQIKPELVAPGVSVRSCAKGGGYRYMTGTSMSAPYIAGLAVLMRQYNPDVSVEEIKSAIIQSCTDLGVAGEDNAYGHGVPDAELALNLIPKPPNPQFMIERIGIEPDGIAMPGEQVGLELLIRSDRDNIGTVILSLVQLSSDNVSLVVNEATFDFGMGGTAAINNEPFVVAFDSTLHHGLQIPFQAIALSNDRSPLDTMNFSLTVGITPPGTVATHATDFLRFTVSDFGQFGFAPRSIYNLGGDGLRFDNGENLLYEAGIIIGRNTLQVASAVRDSAGNLRPTDFEPSSPLSQEWSAADGGVNHTATLHDGSADVPIPVTVTQQTSVYPDDVFDGWMIVRFWLRNDALEKITNLHLGFLADFDLSTDNDMCAIDELAGLVYQRTSSGPLVGLLNLQNLSLFRVLDNGATKTGYSRDELYGLISNNGTYPGTPDAGDKMMLIGAGSFTIIPGDSVLVAFAVVAGDDLYSLYDNANAATERFRQPTDVDDDWSLLPSGFSLDQNFPNPFNPVTTIAFALASSGEVKLDVFNILGQRVRTLADDRFAAGRHTVRWDGTNDRGLPVASGVYLYRLTTPDGSCGRKMLLLK